MLGVFLLFANNVGLIFGRLEILGECSSIYSTNCCRWPGKKLFIEDIVIRAMATSGASAEVLSEKKHIIVLASVADPLCEKGGRTNDIALPTSTSPLQ